MKKFLLLLTFLLAPVRAEPAPPKKPVVVMNRSQRAASYRFQVHQKIHSISPRKTRFLREQFAVAARHEPELSNIFKQEEVPLTLLGIGFKESDFRSGAIGKGTTLGVFQLQPGTARKFGLAVSYSRDERRDIVRSAGCVARYLRHLHGMFDDWGLVILAYKLGEGNLKKILAKRRARSMNELLVYLLPETKQYLLGVLAYGILYHEYLADERISNWTRDRYPPT